ncbi:endopeptidase La [Sulfurovum sp. XTW-4]|uniref:Lon protease n=1 Tax=Sulfurovum xiamenensis TaxID=3019066 RepID=A0ABT7QP92_9BACT|nr:endopeptidase La [Sulfurovum xiamenensis]MDM5262893.1 endopeptidase La [Sulfurovum xiamenensis]
MQLSDYDAFPTTLPIVVEDELFLYPFMISPIFLTDQKDIDAAADAMENNSLLFVTSSMPGKEGTHDFDTMYKVGVIGSIMRKVHIPDGRVKILFQGLARGKIVEPQEGPFNRAVIDVVTLESYNKLKADALMDILRDKVKKLSALNSQIPADLVRTIEENDEPNRIADLVSSMLKLDKEVAYVLYVEMNIEKRLLGLIDIVTSQIESAKVQREIRTKVHSKIEQTNKEYFLKEQLKEIQQELGMDTQREEEIANFREKIAELKPHMQEDAFKEISKQLDRFARMHPDSADANVLQSYLEWVLELPFGKLTKKNLSVKDVSLELDKDHYSLEKPKERIVEFFSVRELAELRGIKQKETGGVILCFAGPPGVGKTSLANSIATALGRPLVRMALGGLEDVNELRGHRRTYVGAMPGRLVQGLIEAKSMDPVIVLDEIDKVGRSMRGDPTAALLEILDPEQNSKYRDYYLNFNIDLSKAIFIATANDVGRIPAPLRDRMEFIGLNSYTPKEKFEIAKRYLIPQELKKHALKSREFSITDKALKTLIDEYTREAGVRNLRRRIAGLMRKGARQLLEDKTIESISITRKNLEKFTDKKVFEISQVDSKPQVGIVSGLAWTAVGGDVLTIEAIKIKGKGALQLTGSLGDVMKESVRIAHSVVKILIDSGELPISPSIIPHSAKEREERIAVDPSEVYKRYDLHIHVPEGATPKDGPSAGIAMVSAIASILSGQKIDNKVAMTGEVTLTGKVLPIGGLKEKLIAAYKAGVEKALIPMKNYERDLDDIPDEVKNNVKVIGVSRIEEVLKEIFVK